jgi:histidine triad (HIT) family protein
MGDCVFCELLVTGDARWVAQERDAVAFLPLESGTLAPGHSLVVPRRHVVGVLDAPVDVLATTIELAQRVGRAMVEGLGATGVVVLNASGPDSGQSVFHLHLHVVPSWPDDGAAFWPADRSTHVVDGLAHERIAAALAAPAHGGGA